MSQTALARQSRTDRSQLIDYELGRIWPQAEPLSRLLATLGATAVDLAEALEVEARAPGRRLEPAGWIAEHAARIEPSGERAEPEPGDREIGKVEIKIELDTPFTGGPISIGPGVLPVRSHGRRTP